MNLRNVIQNYRQNPTIEENESDKTNQTLSGHLDQFSLLSGIIYTVREFTIIYALTQHHRISSTSVRSKTCHGTPESWILTMMASCICVILPRPKQVRAKGNNERTWAHQIHSRDSCQWPHWTHTYEFSWQSQWALIPSVQAIELQCG